MLAQRRGVVDLAGPTVWSDRTQARYSASVRREAMAENSNDPVAIWQNMLGEMEKGFNSFANQAMASPEFSKVVNQVGGGSGGARKQVGELQAKYILLSNFPRPGRQLSLCRESPRDR